MSVACEACTYFNKHAGPMCAKCDHPLARPRLTSLAAPVIVDDDEPPAVASEVASPRAAPPSAFAPEPPRPPPEARAVPPVEPSAHERNEYNRRWNIDSEDEDERPPIKLARDLEGSRTYLQSRGFAAAKRHRGPRERERDESDDEADGARVDAAMSDALRLGAPGLMPRGVMSFGEIRCDPSEADVEAVLGAWAGAMVSLKYDGHQAVWLPREQVFRSRNRNGARGGSVDGGWRVAPPPGWLRALPARGDERFAIAGELFIPGEPCTSVNTLWGRGGDDATRRRRDALWRQARWRAFDVCASDADAYQRGDDVFRLTFAQRCERLARLLPEADDADDAAISRGDLAAAAARSTLPVARVAQRSLPSAGAIHDFFERVVRAGGEGVVLTGPEALIVPHGVERARSDDRVKLKARSTMEGEIVGHEFGGRSTRGDAREGDQERVLKCLRVKIAGREQPFKLGVGHEGLDLYHMAFEWERIHWQSYFPIGHAVTFSFRYIDREGIPQESSFIGLYDPETGTAYEPQEFLEWRLDADCRCGCLLDLGNSQQRKSTWIGREERR